MWTSLRKGSTGLHVSSGLVQTNNLFAHDVRARAADGTLELALDLGSNLRGRHKKSSSTYYDTRRLADGEIERLTLVQLHDAHIFKGLEHVIEHGGELGPEWTLIIELEGQHTFRVRPEYRAGLLWLHVLAAGQ